MTLKILTTGPGEHSDVSYIYTHCLRKRAVNVVSTGHQKITTNVIVYKCRTCQVSLNSKNPRGIYELQLGRKATDLHINNDLDSLMMTVLEQQKITQLLFTKE